MKMNVQPRSSALSALLLATVAHLVLSPLVAEELLSNPGFEELQPGAVLPKGWSENAAYKGTITVISSEHAPHSGRSCLRLESSSPTKECAVQNNASQPISLDKWYRCKIWAKGNGTLCLNMYQYTDATNIIPEQNAYSKHFDVTDQWAEYSFFYIPRKEDLVTKGLFAVHALGQVDVDDASLTECDPKRSEENTGTANAPLPIRKTPVLPARKQGDASPLTFRVYSMPSYKCFWIGNLDISKHPKRAVVDRVRVEIRQKGSGAASFTKEFAADKLPLSNVPLENIDLGNDTYVVKAALLDKNGETLDTVDGESTIIVNDYSKGGRTVFDKVVKTEFSRPKFPFLGNALGAKRAVLPPFTPVKVHQNVVSVWGRDYSLNGLGLPEQVRVLQPEPTVSETTEDLFTSGISMVMRRGKREIAFLPLTSCKIKTAKEGDRVSIQASAAAGALTLNFSNTLEQDGMMRVEMDVIPKEKCSVDELRLRISIRESQATLMHELTADLGDKFRARTRGNNRLFGHSGFVPNATRDRGVVWDSSESVNETIYGTFRPMIWLGNEDRGFCWFADTDQGWLLDDSQPALEMIKRPGEVILQIKFVNHPVVLEQPTKIVFGLLATPVKPLPAGWRGRIYPTYLYFFNEPRFRPLQNLRSFLGLGSSYYYLNSALMSPYPTDWDEARNKYKELQDNYRNALYMEYWCSDNMSIAVRELQDHVREWCGMNMEAYTYGLSPYTTYGIDENTVALTKRHVPGYQDFHAWCLDEKLKRCGLFACYEDDSQQQAFFDPVVGIGYQRKDGKTQKEFDTFSYRKFLKRMAAIYRENDCENLLTVHKSFSMVIPAFSFAVMALDGEQRYIEKEEQGDYIDNWPDLEYIRATIMGRQFGIIGVFLSEIHLKTDPEGKQTRACMALILPHDIEIWPGFMPNREPMTRWYEIKNQFGFGKESTRLYPYWASEKYQLVTSDSNNMLVTAWKGKDKLLIVASNLGEEKEPTLRIDLEKAGVRKTARLVAKDAETGQNLELQGGSIKLKVNRHDYRILMVEPGKR